MAVLTLSRLENLSRYKQAEECSNRTAVRQRLSGTKLLSGHVRVAPSHGGFCSLKCAYACSTSKHHFRNKHKLVQYYGAIFHNEVWQTQHCVNFKSDLHISTLAGYAWVNCPQWFNRLACVPWHGNIVVVSWRLFCVSSASCCGSCLVDHLS